MPSVAKSVAAIFTARSALWIGASLSSVVGLAFYVVIANTIESNAQERFDNMTRSVKTTLDGRVKSYTDVLRGSASLFQTTTNLTREQFHRYVDGLSLEKEFPGIQTINFARYVTEAERPAFEESMRKEMAIVASNYPPFKITPPGIRSSYTVLTYIEPISAWGNRFGADISARGNIPALEAGRDSGALQASGKPIAPLSGPNRVGLAMRLPIYRSGNTDLSLEGRRAAYVGTVGIGFTVHKLVQDILLQVPVRNVRMTLSDTTPESQDGARRIAAPFVLFDSLATDTVPAPPPATIDGDTFISTLPMEFGKRSWTLRLNVRRSDLYTRFDTYVPWLSLVAGFVTTMLLYMLYHTLATSRRSALALAQSMTHELRASEAQLQLSNETLRRLAEHSDKIKEGERKRIAREIHDDLGQNLLALRIEADMLSARTSMRHPRLHERALSTLHQIDTTIKSVRQIINDLRPTVLDLGLNAAVDWQVSEFRRRTGLECELIENNQDIQVGEQCATALFRILQESLNNISKHARATRVRVELRAESDQISMTVTDNGIGLQTSGRHKPGSFGLVGIEERINILGGTFSLNSSRGEGTTVHVSVPPLRDNITPPMSRDDQPETHAALA